MILVLTCRLMVERRRIQQKDDKTRQTKAMGWRCWNSALDRVWNFKCAWSTVYGSNPINGEDIQYLNTDSQYLKELPWHGRTSLPLLLLPQTSSAFHSDYTLMILSPGRCQESGRQPFSLRFVMLFNSGPISWYLKIWPCLQVFILAKFPFPCQFLVSLSSLLQVSEFELFKVSFDGILFSWGFSSIGRAVLLSEGSNKTACQALKVRQPQKPEEQCWASEFRKFPLQPFQPFLQSYIPRVFQNNLLLPCYLLSIAFATSLLLKCHAVIQLNKMDETLTIRKQHSSTVASPLCNSFFGTGIHSGWDYASTYFAPANQSPHKSILTSSLLGVDGTSQDRERGFQLHFAGANEDRLKEAKQWASELTESIVIWCG